MHSADHTDGADIAGYRYAMVCPQLGVGGPGQEIGKRRAFTLDW